MKIFLIFLAVFTAGILGLWCWTYDAYDDTQKLALSYHRAGNFPSMRNVLEKHEASRAAYPIFHSNFLDVFAKRLAYSKGVAFAGLGDFKKAEVAFREASQSREREISFMAIYNNAEYFINRGELDAAAEEYRKVLRIIPGDIQAKINLELLLKKIQERNEKAGKLKKDGDQSPESSDYWRRNIPESGQGNSGSARIWR